jgi:hypothetical protein
MGKPPDGVPGAAQAGQEGIDPTDAAHDSPGQRGGPGTAPVMDVLPSRNRDLILIISPFVAWLTNFCRKTDIFLSASCLYSEERQLMFIADDGYGEKI